MSSREVKTVDPFVKAVMYFFGLTEDETWLCLDLTSENLYLKTGYLLLYFEQKQVNAEDIKKANHTDGEFLKDIVSGWCQAFSVSPGVSSVSTLRTEVITIFRLYETFTLKHKIGVDAVGGGAGCTYHGFPCLLLPNFCISTQLI